MADLFPPVDFADFHRRRLPDLLAEHGDLAAADVAGVDPLGFRVGDDAFTYVADGGRIRVAPGTDEAATVAVLEPERWTEFAHELRSSFGLMIGEVVSFDRGDFGLLVRWEPALRAIWHGRPIYDDAAVQAVADLDLSATFTLEDSEADLRAFFEQAGFLHLRGVFAEAEMAALADEADRVQAEARFDDGTSWWAATSDGRDVCCRVIYSGERSELIREVAHDHRLAQLTRALTDRELHQCSDRLDGEPLLFKHPDVVEGLADLPWHRDCGMGGHPVLCPSLKYGIQIDPATAANGQLSYLAGSHHHSNHMPRERDLERLPTHAVTTERGDVTLHMAHVLHVAPPPGGRHDGRRTLYVNYEQPLVWDVVEPHHGYNDSVLAKKGRVAL